MIQTAYHAFLLKSLYLYASKSFPVLFALFFLKKFMSYMNFVGVNFNLNVEKDLTLFFFFFLHLKKLQSAGCADVLYPLYVFSRRSSLPIRSTEDA